MPLAPTTHTQQRIANAISYMNATSCSRESYQVRGRDFDMKHLQPSRMIQDYKQRNQHVVHRSLDCQRPRQRRENSKLSMNASKDIHLHLRASLAGKKSTIREAYAVPEQSPSSSCTARYRTIPSIFEQASSLRYSSRLFEAAASWRSWPSPRSSSCTACLAART